MVSYNIANKLVSDYFVVEALGNIHEPKSVHTKFYIATTSSCSLFWFLCATTERYYSSTPFSVTSSSPLSLYGHKFGKSNITIIQAWLLPCLVSAARTSSGGSGFRSSKAGRCKEANRNNASTEL